MWLYIFGSTVRGEIDPQSDVDVLAVLEEKSAQIGLPKNFLVYSKSELMACFEKGDLFAHHLTSESRLVHSNNGSDLIQDLGRPAIYQSGVNDFACFYEIGNAAISQLMRKNCSIVFELGILYMAIRDIAMILSYHEGEVPSFSKYAPYYVTPRLTLDRKKYEFIKNCRAASTRGSVLAEKRDILSNIDLIMIREWLKSAERVLNERIQRKNRVAAKNTGVC